MRLVPALIVAALALTACDPQSSGTDLQNSEQARAAELAKLTGWERAFQPDAALAAANQFGLRAISYSPTTDGYRAIGGPVMIASAASGLGSQVDFKATGATEALVDKLVFDLGMQDPKNAKIARERFADLIRDFLFQSKIDAAPIHDAIAKGTVGEGTLDGAPYTITSTDTDQVGVEHLIVTFNRPGATAPAHS